MWKHVAYWQEDWFAFRLCASILHHFIICIVPGAKSATHHSRYCTETKWHLGQLYNNERGRHFRHTRSTEFNYFGMDTRNVMAWMWCCANLKKQKNFFSIADTSVSDGFPLISGFTHSLLVSNYDARSCCNSLCSQVPRVRFWGRVQSLRSYNFRICLESIQNSTNAMNALPRTAKKNDFLIPLFSFAIFFH